MFSISHTEHRSRLAKIEIGSFKEEFYSDSNLSSEALEELWDNQLNRIKEENALVLPYWMQDGIASRGWVMWRENEIVHIQDMLFPEGLRFEQQSIPKRETKNEDGYRISEWSTNIQSIENFLSGKEQNKTR